MQTTLAMSILWGLTGSLDARLVSDGKAYDVAYDAHASSVKATAEVSIRGTINTVPFSVTRSKGSRKTELQLVVGSEDMTTQSVKDTQELIDELLGVGDGLLQRSCFFGQHSHTMQSLLGLTDAKLKAELSLLVDVGLWNAALLDVKTREKTSKSRVSELTIELRVREEEVTRMRNNVKAIQNSVIVAELKIVAAREHLQSISVDGGNTEVVNFTEVELQTQLKSIMARRAEMQKGLSSCRQALLTLSTGESSSRLASTEANLAVSRENAARTQASLQSYLSQRNAGNSKQKQLELQLESLKFKMIPLLEKIRPLRSGSSVDGDIGPVVSTLRADTESKRATLAVTESKLRDAKTGALKVKAVLDDVAVHARKVKGDQQHVLEADSCPTCGQELHIDKLMERLKQLEAEVHILTQQKSQYASELSTSSVILDAAHKLVEYQKEQKQLSPRLQEIISETSTQTKALTELENSVLVGKEQVKALTSEKEMLRKDMDDSKRQITSKLLKLEEENRGLDSEENLIRSNLEKVNCTLLVFSSRPFIVKTLTLCRSSGLPTQ
jgi:hypothetical protein